MSYRLFDEPLDDFQMDAVSSPIFYPWTLKFFYTFSPNDQANMKGPFNPPKCDTTIQ